jgi:phosphatidylserine/phosphatidylglycerophosphate/cardiolipin synthase-like enzyme
VGEKQYVLIISPNTEDKFLDLIASANNSIDVEMYLFTNKALASALIDAKKRGVQVRVIIDRKGEGDGVDDVISMLTFDDIPVKRSSRTFETTHAKFAIIDRKLVIIGSHNWTNYAMDRNREVSVVINDASLAEELSRIFEQDWSIATVVTVATVK